MTKGRTNVHDLLTDEDLIARADADPARQAARKALRKRLASGELGSGSRVENLSEFLHGIRKRMGR